MDLKARARAVPGVAPVLDVNDRVGELGGGFLASAVTLSLFLSLFPVLLVAIAVLGFLSTGNDHLGADLVRHLGLDGDSASFVTNGLKSAENSRAATSIVGFLGLVWAALGVVGAIAHVCDRAWQVADRGLKEKLAAAIWLFGSLLLLGIAFTVAGLLPALPGWAAPLEVVVGIAANTAFFLWTFRVLTAKPLPLRAHLPGAILGGVGFHVLTIVGATVVPRQAASSSALYGSIGVVLAVLGWLLLFGRLLVYSVALNVVRYEKAHGVVHVEVAAPRFKGEAPVAGDRSGIVVKEA